MNFVPTHILHLNLEITLGVSLKRLVANYLIFKLATPAYQMPLFIDLHIDPSLTPEDVKQCHVADKEIQEKYGVRYLQILLNHLFCLVEGPDKETCARVHREAHGNVACNVLEITESDFSALLIGKQKDESDFTIHADGTVDTGVRAILTFQMLGTPENCEAAKPVMLAILHKYGGKNTESLLSPSTVIFHSC